MDKKSLSHTAWKCQYHIVFIPKYRKKSLYGQIRTDVREIIQTLCGYKGVEIVSGAVCMDHVHLCVSIPPKMSISNFMGYLKGKSTLMIYDRHPNLQNKWNKAFWARGYYVATIGNVTEEAIQKYIAEQSEESKKEDSEGAAFQRQPVKCLRHPPFRRAGNKDPLGGQSKPPLEVVVGDLAESLLILFYIISFKQSSEFLSDSAYFPLVIIGV